MIDETFAPDRTRTYYKAWPSTPDGDIDDNGTIRKMTDAEVAEWHARQPPPPPLIDPAQWPDDDERIATDALLTEDSIQYRAVVELLVAKGIISSAEVAAAQAAATERLLTLTDQPGVRRAMMADRIARAEAARPQRGLDA